MYYTNIVTIKKIIILKKIMKKKTVRIYYKYNYIGKNSLSIKS